MTAACGDLIAWGAAGALPLCLPASLGPALAGPALIPSPCPDAAPGAAPLDPEPLEPDGPQRLMRDLYPQATGDLSQGNPPIARRHRHQHLVPGIYRRKCRVDRP